MDRNRKPPQWVNDLLRRFGRNPWGEPIYRVVWAETQSQLVGARWPDGKSEYRMIPKYPGVQRWILEKWLSTEKLGASRVLWAAQNTDAESGLVQPFPWKGDYECALVLELPKSKTFMPLSPGFMDHVCRMIERSNSFTVGERMAAHKAAEEKKDKEVKNVRRDIVDNAMSAFAGQQASFSGQQHRGGFKSKVFKNPVPYTGFGQRQGGR